MEEEELALEDAIEMVLKKNLEIEIEKSNTSIATEQARGARGVFDPTFRWLPGLESRNTPTGSVLQGAGGILSEHFLSQNAYLQQQLPVAGLQWGVDFENGRQSSTNPFVSLSPVISARFTLHITQPLIRNRRIDAQRAELKIRRKQRDLSEVEFELRAIDVVTRAEHAYWDLVAAREDAGVKADSVNLGRDQLERDRGMISAGTLARVEIAASEAEYQRRLDDWYASAGAVTEAENALKTLLAGGRYAELWSEELIPPDTRALDRSAGNIVNLREHVDQALSLRPELRASDIQHEANDTQKRQNAGQIKPQVNLVAAWSSTGIGGSLRPATPIPGFPSGGVPDMLVGGYGTSLSNLFGGRYQSLQAGIALDFTFRNTTAEAKLGESVIIERRIKLQRRQTEQAIEAQVRNALQAMQTARQRMAAAEASARAAKEKLDSETRLFETGESTNFLVLTRQNEYADSRRRQVVARLEHNRALARLEQAAGTTLHDHHVAVE